ncbi:hypothetical protein LPW11_10720 [Geomonas sp. RF6]|uniref:hypothetical protein n=1 Tax=Geomonas sp. RF6 TaxID=2897342 RepID=UPI001E39BB1B|nr:hypothetical protein [Geomonas sp. RF6]UFS72646.1 hypothetical protein LPW11_10720 [Geomonas sp. RF6]
MRPKKNDDERKSILINLRLTKYEVDIFRTQAFYHGKAVSEYLRDLVRSDGIELHAKELVRKDEEGRWEVWVMGEWRRVPGLD